MKSSEQKIYGRNACLAFAKHFPQAVIRAYCTESNRGRLGALLKFLAEKKRAYHIVTEGDLHKICDSEHHEGICLLVERQAAGSEAELIAALQKTPQAAPHCVLCLDGISNPHNLGAIVRSAAHFGIKHILLSSIGEESRKALLSGAFHRTAEGGGVHVRVYVAEEPAALLKRLQKEMGWTIVATSSHAQSKELNNTQLPKRCVMVMGSESEGITPPLLALADIKLRIKGTGHVESLNVASATAIVLNEFSRQIENQRKSKFKSGDMPTRVARVEGRNRKGS
jgi:TrmH RNA methyltransferase